MLEIEKLRNSPQHLDVTSSSHSIHESVSNVFYINRDSNSDLAYTPRITSSPSACGAAKSQLVYPGVPPPFSFTSKPVRSAKCLPVYSGSRRTPPPPPPPPIRRPPAPSISKQKSSEPIMVLLKIPKPPHGLIPRRLQWKNVNETQVLGSFWETLVTSTSQQEASSLPVPVRFNVDFKLLTILFFENPSQRKRVSHLSCTGSSALDVSGQEGPQASARRAYVTVLDAKRRQNIEICLKGLGLLDNIAPLIQTVVDLIPFQSKSNKESDQNFHCLTAENLQLVLSLYPTKQEEELLRSAIKPTEKNICFGKAETFLVELLNIEYFQERAECCLIALTLTDDVTALISSMKTLCDSISKISNTLTKGAFQSILQYLLRAGNYLNHGSHKGECRGFSLEYLPQVKNVRSIDNSTTLLRILAEAVEEQCPSIWNELKETFSLDSNVSDSWLKTTNLTFLTMKSKMELIQSQLLKMKNDACFTQVFSNFKTVAEKLLCEMEITLEKANDKLIHLAYLCGERERTTTSGFHIIRYLTYFYKDLCHAHDENLKFKKRSYNRTQGSCLRFENQRALVKQNEQDHNNINSAKEAESTISLIEQCELDCSTAEASQIAASEVSSNEVLYLVQSPQRKSDHQDSLSHSSEALIMKDPSRDLVCNINEVCSQGMLEAKCKVTQHPIVTTTNTTHICHLAYDNSKPFQNERCKTESNVRVTRGVLSPSMSYGLLENTLGKSDENKSRSKVSRLVFNRLLNSLTQDKSSSKHETLRDMLKTKNCTLKSSRPLQFDKIKSTSDKLKNGVWIKEFRVIQNHFPQHSETPKSSPFYSAEHLKLRSLHKDTPKYYPISNCVNENSEKCFLGTKIGAFHHMTQDTSTVSRNCFLERFYNRPEAPARILPSMAPLFSD